MGCLSKGVAQELESRGIAAEFWSQSFFLSFLTCYGLLSVRVHGPIKGFDLENRLHVHNYRSMHICAALRTLAIGACDFWNVLPCNKVGSRA